MGNYCANNKQEVRLSEFDEDLNFIEPMKVRGKSKRIGDETSESSNTEDEEGESEQEELSEEVIRQNHQKILFDQYCE